MATKKQGGGIEFSFRVWSKNFDGKLAYSDQISISVSNLTKSNWLQDRIAPVVKTNEEFKDWVIWMAELIDELYQPSSYDRWYYYGPTNYQIETDNYKLRLKGNKALVEYSSDSLNEIRELIKGDGDMRDQNQLFDFKESHGFQLMPFAYYFAHHGSILNGDDFIELNYPKRFDMENWEESERGWEIC